MRPTQMELEKWIKWVMVVIGTILMVTMKDFRNLVLTTFFIFVIVVLPFWLDSLVRFKFIPFLDSLNKSESRYVEEFSLWFKVSIWGFIGLTMSVIWTVFVPLIYSLPLWIGWLARNVFGAERLTWGVWLYGWMIAFLFQYLVNFGFGWGMNDRDSFEDRFEYPNE